MNIKRLPLIVSLTLGCFSSLSYADDLEQIYQLALTKDPQVLKSAATVDANKEGIIQARSALYPQLKLTGRVAISDDEFSSKINNTGTGSYISRTTERISNSYTFDLSQEVFNLKTWSQLETQQKRALQSEVNYKLAKQNLITRVAQVYFDILKAQDDLEFAKAENKAIERQLEQTNQRFKVGLTAITDVHEARAKFDNSAATVIRSENAVEIKKELLREITGQFPGALASLNTSRFSTAQIERDANDWVALATNSNNELQAQTISMDIALEKISNAEYGHLPTLSLGASWGRSNSNKIEQTNDGQSLPVDNPPRDESKSISLNLSVPIFSGFRTESEISQAQAEYIAAGEDREITYRKVVRTVRTSYANVKTLISTIKALEQAVTSADSALKATDAGFEVGTRTIVDVLDSTQALYRAKSNLASARYDYIMEVLNLKLSSGTITEEDVRAINKGLGS